MAYDAALQSLALIDGRELVRVDRLSRRRRFVAMSVDVDDRNGVAVTSFARRGVGCVWHDMHVLARRDGRWALLGGGGSGTDGDLLADRPAELTGWPDTVDAAGPTGLDGRSLLTSGSAGRLRDTAAGTDRWPWSGRWIDYTEVRATRAVESLTIADRTVAVPWHGRVVLVWTGRGRQRVRARDHRGRIIDELVLAR